VTAGPSVTAGSFSERRMNTREISTCELVYERDLSTEINQQMTVNRVSLWLGLLAGEYVQTNFCRQIPDRYLSELVTNYGGIRFLRDKLSGDFPVHGS
jgi:hypothetical protein